MVKVISLSEKAYRLLADRKGDRSFSEEIVKLVETDQKKGNVSGLRKFFGTIDQKTADKWKQEIERGRRDFGRSRG